MYGVVNWHIKKSPQITQWSILLDLRRILFGLTEIVRFDSRDFFTGILRKIQIFIGEGLYGFPWKIKENDMFRWPIILQRFALRNNFVTNQITAILKGIFRNSQGKFNIISNIGKIFPEKEIFPDSVSTGRGRRGQSDHSKPKEIFPDEQGKFPWHRGISTGIISMYLARKFSPRPREKFPQGAGKISPLRGIIPMYLPEEGVVTNQITAILKGIFRNSQGKFILFWPRGISRE